MFVAFFHVRKLREWDVGRRVEKRNVLVVTGKVIYLFVVAVTRECIQGGIFFTRCVKIRSIFFFIVMIFKFFRDKSFHFLL